MTVSEQEDIRQIVKLQNCTVAEVFRFIDDKKRHGYAPSSNTKGRLKRIYLSKVVESQIEILN